MLEGSALIVGTPRWWGFLLLETESGHSGTRARASGKPWRDRRRRSISGGTAWWVISTLGVFGSLSIPSHLFATHEADHRFTVEGFVCNQDGKASPQIEVLVKDTRVTVGQTVKTDSDGYYKVTLHLHNDNLGDPLLVEAGPEQKEFKVQFDPKDLETERHLRVDFGSGCERDLGPPLWLVYGFAGVVVVIGGLIGLKIFKKRKRDAQRTRKGQGKRQK